MNEWTNEPHERLVNDCRIVWWLIIECRIWLKCLYKGKRKEPYVDSSKTEICMDLYLKIQCFDMMEVNQRFKGSNGAKINLRHLALVNQLISQTEKMTSARKMGISPQISSWLGHRIPCMGIKGENAPCDRKLQEACSQPSEMTWDSNLLMDQHWESLKHRGEWYTMDYGPMQFRFW